MKTVEIALIICLKEKTVVWDFCLKYTFAERLILFLFFIVTYVAFLK